jgi:hypothetical protein
MHCVFFGSAVGGYDANSFCEPCAAVAQKKLSEKIKIAARRIDISLSKNGRCQFRQSVPQSFRQTSLIGLADGMKKICAFF